MSHPSWFFRLLCASCAGVLVLAPASAGALELSGGVSVGGIQVGTDPRLAVSAFGGLHWRTEGSFLLKAHTMFSILPGPRVGIYERTAAALGYGWKTVNVGLGPSLSIYSMPVCGVVICNHVVGVAPGGHVEAEWFFSDPLGVAVSANLDWAGGSSRVLPGGLVMMVTAGPVLRLQTRSK